jgi:large repetitive protein
MTNKSLLNFSMFFMLFVTIYFTACKKSTVAEPPVATCATKTIVVTATTTPAASPTATNGSITASATGSTGFTFSKDGTTFQASGTFSSLAAGNYTITAKDDAGCTSSKAFVVTATSCPTITVAGTATNPTTLSGTGTIDATATGSVAPYTFSKDGTTFQTSGTFAGLGSGTFTIIAKDANGCTGSRSFTISSFTCTGTTIVVTGIPTAATGPANANGSISASATGGLAPYTYSRDGVTFLGAGVSIFNSLLPMGYTITAKDANGCLGVSGAIVVGNGCPIITLNATTTGADKCLNPTTSGAVSVSAIGSTGLMYNINNGTYQTGTLFGSLAPGTYTMGVRDLNGCTTTISATVAVAPAGPNFTAVKAVMLANCATPGCHVGATPQSGINLSDDCTIVSQRLRIKARAVDANPSVMPPAGAISNADKQKITDWINAGGGHRN